MPDDFQQFKGLLGQQIALLHLSNFNQWTIADEEAKVQGVDSRARLDIVAQCTSNGFCPIEVKFQEYNFERYGVAFEHVLSELGNGREVYAIDRSNNKLRLSNPTVYLWFPPSSRITDVPFYRDITVVTFEQVIQDLRSSLGNRFLETISSKVRGKVEAFFRTHGCSLTQNQRDNLAELFPNP